MRLRRAAGSTLKPRASPDVECATNFWDSLRRTLPDREPARGRALRSTARRARLASRIAADGSATAPTAGDGDADVTRDRCAHAQVRARRQHRRAHRPIALEERAAFGFQRRASSRARERLPRP